MRTVILIRKYIAILLLFLFPGSLLAQTKCACVPASSGLPAAFMGMDVLSALAGNIPTVTFGAWRSWDNGCTWADIEQAAGVYTWTCLDHALANAGTAGTDVMYTMYGVPVLTGYNSNPTASCSNSAGYCSPPADLATGDTHWKAFVTALVNHSLASGTKIKYYNPWNEPNAGNYFNGTIPQLVTMANDAYTIIHSLDPNAIVVGPSPTGINPDIWLTSYYADGGLDDITSFHGNSSLATTLTDASAVQNVMAGAGKGTQQLWCTECDWGATQNSSFTDAQKQAFLVQEYVQLWGMGLSRVYWYAWTSSTIGTLCTGSNPCVVTPAGTAYNSVAQWLVGSQTRTGENPCTASGTTTTCTYILSGAAAEILWDTANTPTVTVPSNYTTQHNADGTSSAITGHQVTLGSIPIQIL